MLEELLNRANNNEIDIHSVVNGIEEYSRVITQEGRQISIADQYHLRHLYRKILDYSRQNATHRYMYDVWTIFKDINTEVTRGFWLDLYDMWNGELERKYEELRNGKKPI